MLTPLVMTPWRRTRWASRCPGCAGCAWPAALPVGTLLVIRPGGAVFQWAMLLPLALVLANTAYQIITSRLARSDDARSMHFYTGAVGTVLCSLALPWAWQPLPVSMWLMLALMGVLATVGDFLLGLAYSRVTVAVLTPYLYLQVGFAAFGGWLVFAHVPDAWSLAGIAVVTACGVYGTWLTTRESRAATDAATAVS